MKERISKLLILVGDEAVKHEKRDFDIIVNTIVNDYLAKNTENIENIILQKLLAVVSEIPLKQHLYAGLTAKISLKNKQLTQQIIQTAINNLDTALSEFQFHHSINILNFLSELMNIMLLNSLTFMNLLEDILEKIQATNHFVAKRFYTTVLMRSLPICLWSISQKLFSELKKFMDLLQNHVQNDSLFSYLKNLVVRGKIINFSLMGRLQDKFEGIPQFSFKIKLRIQTNLQKIGQWNPVEYLNLNSQIEDELYKQFCQQEGRIHQLIIEQLIQTFYLRGSILNMKIDNYLNSIPSHKQVYLYRFTISTLIAKSLKSLRPIVEQSLLLNLINNFNDQKNQQNRNLTKEELSSMLENQISQIFVKSQILDFGMILSVANLISFFIVNVKRSWDWEKYLEGENDFVKRRALLLLILQKVKVLNQNFVLPEIFSQFTHYQFLDNLTTKIDYTTAEQLEIFEKFEENLKKKASAQKINQIIVNEQLYAIFLQALFRRTSISHTHLNGLIERYKDVLNANKEHDWVLINKIRNFWKNSYLYRQLYLQIMIKNDFITFTSYVNYIGQLKDKNEREMVWIKIELSQLNSQFGNVKKIK